MGRSSLANSLMKMILNETAKQVKRSVKNNRKTKNIQNQIKPKDYSYTHNNKIEKVTFQNAEGIKTIHLDTIDASEFEKLCQLIFLRISDNEVERTPLVNDLGKDLIIYSEEGKTFVECKHHLDRTIGRPVEQKLHSAVISEGAIKWIVITTGVFSKGAIEYANKVHPPIELIDKRLLFDLSSRAGLTLKTAMESGSVYTYPITNDENLKYNLSQHLEQKLISKPKKIIDNIKIINRKICLKPIYFAKYNIDAVFETSVGIIHSENDTGTIFISGTNGNTLDEKLSQRFINITPKNFVSSNTHNVNIIPFKLLSNHAKDEFVNHITRKHTKNVSYVGRNNVSYTKNCIPKSKDIFISNIKQTYIPENEIDFNLMGKNRYFKIADNGIYDFYVYEQNVSTCEICNKSVDQARILCNECGSISHNKSFWKSHGFYCSNCGKSICRICASYYKKFLIFTKVLCKDCTKTEEKEGRKIKKFKPIY